MDLVLFLAGSLLLLILYFTFLAKKSGNLPPGPTGLPIIGNLTQLGGEPARTIAEWSRKFGRTVLVQMGMRPLVIMHDPDVVKAVFSDENATGRDPNFVFNHIFQSRGFLQGEGEAWKEQRRFGLTTLRDLGMGKTGLEDAILMEVTAFMDKMGSYKGQLVDPRPFLTASVSNVICALTFGQRYEHTNERFLRLSGLIADNVRLTGFLLPVQAFPFLQYIPFIPVRKSLDQLYQNIFDVLGFVRGLIKEHKPEGNSNQEVADRTDFISAWFDERAKQAQNKKITSFNDEEQLTFGVMSLFAAGTETTTSTLLWAFVYLVRYPDIQKKIAQEIENNVGLDRPITNEDKGNSKLRYTEAAIFDIQRLASIAPLGVPHTNFEPMKIDGYDIPARTVLQVNINGLHHDPQYWTRPEEWYPEHFLNSVNELFIPKAFMPFSVGKRACLGESLAKMELFLFFANILQQFEIQGDLRELAGVKNPKIGLIDSPLSYSIRFVPRRS